MKPTLGKVARQANDYLAGWLHRQPVVKEESLTDWLLDYFQQNTPDVRYYEFDRLEEARSSGADWDWWFLLQSGCFKIRVQAKKLRQTKDHYPELARSNQTGYQIDILLDSSAVHNFYPLYVLYAKTEGVERCVRVPEPTVLSICSAQETYDLVFGSARHRIDSKDVLALSIPLECLFCCPLVRDFASHGPESLFRHYFPVPPRGCRGEAETSNGNSHRGYEESVPRVVRTLFEMREIDSNTEGILREYQSMFAGSCGVVIVRAENAHE